MKKTVAYILLIYSFGCSNTKVEKSIFNDCFSEEKAELINEMVNVFEENICKYYKIDRDDSYKAYIKYIDDFIKMDIDLKKITTNNELNLLKKSNSLLVNDIWVKLSENKYTYDERPSDSVYEIDHNDLLLEDLEDRLVVDREYNESDNINYEPRDYLTMNYNGIYANCLMNNDYNSKMTKFIEARNRVGEISPMIIATGLEEFKNEDFSHATLKSIVAFELYYGILNLMSEN